MLASQAAGLLAMEERMAAQAEIQAKAQALQTRQLDQKLELMMAAFKQS